MDIGAEMYNLDYIVGFAGGNSNNRIDFFSNSSTDTTVNVVNTLAAVVEGNNAPNTAFSYRGKNYRSDSFTSMSGNLITDGVANYDVANPHAGQLKVVSGVVSIYTGTDWKQL